MFRLAPLRWLSCGLLLLALAHQAAAEERRVALVIGNSTYQNTAWLKNPRNDAADISAALKQLGFRVVEGLDLDKPAMDGKIDEFAGLLAGADSGVFFYAGHGLQVSGQNYLMPVDARLTTPAALDLEMVPLDVVQRAMERSAKFNVLFVDACRDNPLTGTLAGAMGMRVTEMGRGLAPSMSGLGTLISFSTQPGNVALDGVGRNSPFAAALKKHIASPDDDLSTILINVRNDVVRATRTRQVPWEHSSLWSRFYFAPRPQPPVAATPDTQQLQELSLWSAARSTADAAAFRTYLDRYPQGAFADLARMFIARLDRWEAQGAVVGRGRLVGRSAPLSPGGPGWRAPQVDGDAARCHRTWALLAAKVQEANLQCGSPRRHMWR
jgi:uncharacterized caspase-like protein